MRAFFDSNVFVYALANDDSARQLIAQRLLADHGRARPVVLSIQVLLETYNVLTRKKRAAPADALFAMRLMAQQEVVAPSAGAAMLALDLAVQHGLSAWDALIVQAALEAGCDTLFSEDLQAGRRFGALQVVNPFVPTAHEAVAGPFGNSLSPAPATALRPSPPAAGKARSGRSRR